MRISSFVFVLLSFSFFTSLSARAEMTLVWNDEFSVDGRPDATLWEHETHFGPVNDEVQAYMDRAENSRVENGNLVIEARKEEMDGMKYTSARLTSKASGTWKFGHFEARLKLPLGRGTWPAFWMMPASFPYGSHEWPDSGEVDIMEHVGFDPGVVHSTVHTNAYNWMNNNNPKAQLKLSDGGAGFHVYAMDWNPWELSVSVDGLKIYTYPNPNKSWSEWPFDIPFYVILNLAIGGMWGGQQGIDDASFPQRMYVDYVRVYQTL